MSRKRSETFDALVQQAAGILPQIEDHRLHPLLLHRRDFLPKLRRRSLAHGIQRDVADTAVEHRARRNGLDVDLGADQGVLERVGDAGPPHRDRDLAARRATQRLDRLIVLPALGGLPVDLDDLVTGLHARPLGGSLRQRSHHGDPAVTNVDLDAETRVVAGGLLGQRLVVVSREQHGVGILELLEHAPRRLLVEIGLSQRVHVVRADVAQDVVEQAGLLVHVARPGPPLQQPAAAQKGDRRHQPDHTPALLHTFLHSAQNSGGPASPGRPVPAT